MDFSRYPRTHCHGKSGEKAHTVRETTGLSYREIEMLALISIGSSNDEIAKKMLIGPNTVKTHL